MQTVVIVIPIHKANPTQNEIASFVQCYKILGSHPIRIVAPEGLDVTVYRKAVPDCEFVFIDPQWLSSIEQYNKLKISLYFYQLFKDYEYLLTYELDAWVFRDELLYWCEKEYDYIGAPWFEGYSDAKSDARIKGVGNSGFSLRNVKVCLRALHTLKQLYKHEKLCNRLRFGQTWRIPFYHYYLKERFRLRDFIRVSDIPINHYCPVKDDGFWGEHIPKYLRYFRSANIEDAIKFSFEVNPSILFDMSKKVLPFGCHAWERYEPQFWKNYIDA